MLNTGTWSVAFEDVAYTKPAGRRCYAWIRPEETWRVAELYEWTDPGCSQLEVREEAEVGRLKALTQKLPAVRLPGRKAR